MRESATPMLLNTTREQNIGDVETLKLIFHILSTYGWIPPALLGIPGNIISILVANRRHNRPLSPCVYMTAMGVTDTALLLEGAYFYPLVLSGLLDQYIGSAEFPTILHMYIMFTSGMLSGLFLAAMSVDRLIAVRFPLAAPLLCTTKRARVTVAVISLLVIPINIHMLYTFKYIEDAEAGVRAVITSVPGHEALELLATGFQVLVGTVCPFLIIFASNLIIIITLHRANRARVKMDSSTQLKESKSQKETRFLTRMLIFVSIAYVLTSLPYRMYHFVVRIPAVAAMFHNMENLYWRLRYIVGAYSFFLIWLFNYAINFYLYCIGGGKRYRDDTKDVIKSFCKCFAKDVGAGNSKKLMDLLYQER